MKLRVLFLSIVLSFGLFFSSFAVKPAQASIFETAIENIREFLSAQQKVEEDSSEISLPTVYDSNWHSAQSGVVVAITGGTGGTDNLQVNNGAIHSTANAIATLVTNTPASGERYVADLLHNMKVGPAQPAYAQVGGLGFASLEPILYAWKQFRNIAYLFFIVITLVIGFMIMMRQKIGSQAAVTAQQAIPQIVIALITVTFSYAIAGFLIDLMYVLMYLFVGLFRDQLSGDPISKNTFQIAMEMFTNGIGTVSDSIGTFVEANLGGGGFAEAIGSISGLTFTVIVAITYLFATVQLFIELLKTYISIIVSIVLSPLLLMMGALPGRNDVFSGWIKGLVGNLIAYPVVLLLVILHKLMTTQSGLEGGFLPPFLMGRGSPGAITALIGLSIMLIAKDLVVQAKKSVNPKGGGIFEQFGQALSSAVSKGWKGGEVIPGVGFTDTNKVPVIGKYVGSGKGLLKTAIPAAAGVGGTLVGLGEQARDLNTWRKHRAKGRSFDLTPQGLTRGWQAFRNVDKKIGPGKETKSK